MPPPYAHHHLCCTKNSHLTYYVRSAANQCAPFVRSFAKWTPWPQKPSRLLSCVLASPPMSVYKQAQFIFDQIFFCRLYSNALVIKRPLITMPCTEMVYWRARGSYYYIVQLMNSYIGWLDHHHRPVNQLASHPSVHLSQWMQMRLSYNQIISN